MKKIIKKIEQIENKLKIKEKEYNEINQKYIILETKNIKEYNELKKKYLLLENNYNEIKKIYRIRK